MKQKTLKVDCQFKCGAQVDWYVCDDEGENCVIGTVVQCGHCGRLNTEAPPEVPYSPDWEELRGEFNEWFEKESTTYVVTHHHVADWWIAKLQAREEWLRALLKVAKCPDSSCDGNGTCADGDGEPCQCQWCDERKTVLTPKN